VLYDEHMYPSWSQMLSPILGITKEIMSRGPQAVDMEFREPDELRVALEGPYFIQFIPPISSSSVHPISVVLK
jgi:hypothetical protein